MKTKPCFHGSAFTAMVISIFFVFATQFTFAQKKWNFELRPGVNFPTKNIESSDLKTGFGIEGTFGYQFMTNLGAYAGWGWNQFGSDNTSESSDFDLEETGYTLGLKYHRAFGKSKTQFLIRGGGIYNHIELENTEGAMMDDSGHGFGWQIEGGLALPLGENWQLLPTIRYRALSRDVKIENISVPIDLNYISIGIGISRLF